MTSSLHLEVVPMSMIIEYLPLLSLFPLHRHIQILEGDIYCKHYFPDLFSVFFQQRFNMVDRMHKM